MDVLLATNATDPALALRNCRRLDVRAFACELYVRSNGFVAERQFWFEEPDFSQFRTQLAEMDRSLKGAAELRTRYEENGFRLEVLATGAITVSGTLREYGAMEQRLDFAFITDQTVLAPFVRDLAQLSSLQPPNER